MVGHSIHFFALDDDVTDCDGMFSCLVYYIF